MKHSLRFSTLILFCVLYIQAPLQAVTTHNKPIDSDQISAPEMLGERIETKEQLPIGDFNLLAKAGTCPAKVSSDGSALRDSEVAVWISFGSFASCPKTPVVGSNCIRGPRFGCDYQYCFEFENESRSVTFSENRIEVEIEKDPGGASNITRCTFERTR